MSTQNNGDEDVRTIYCANLSTEVSEALLYELFLQVSYKIDTKFIVKNRTPRYLFVCVVFNFRRAQLTECQYQKKKMEHNVHMVS